MTARSLLLGMSAGHREARDITIRVVVYNGEKTTRLKLSCALAAGFVSHRFVSRRSPNQERGGVSLHPVRIKRLKNSSSVRMVSGS